MRNKTRIMQLKSRFSTTQGYSALYEKALHDDPFHIRRPGRRSR